ncbi:hypothetical protein BDV93DRAFT_120737 [Ceratobasidium sp. AG-I]|nr:hypothetical protein BDV93DRAFT_120737 [Ceratobasidium sp. AG-I]
MQKPWNEKLVLNVDNSDHQPKRNPEGLKKMVVQLTTIPPEVISDIFAYIHEPADLAALARTSSHVRFEATRALYASVKLLSLAQTVRFCQTITSNTRHTGTRPREHSKVHIQSFIFRPRALHIEHEPLPPNPHPRAVDLTPRPTATFFRLLARAIAALPHLTTLDLAWGFLYRHTHPTWTLDFVGTHPYLRTLRFDGVEDAGALERFLARHRPTEGGCLGLREFENRSWLDMLDPLSPRGSHVLKHFAPGLLPVAMSFAGPASMMKSMGACAGELVKARVWSWGYGSAEEELAGIHESLAGNGETLWNEWGEKRLGCGILEFSYVSKTLIEDLITLAGTYIPDVVHLTIEGYEPGRTPLPEKLPSLPRLESITIVARACRPTEQLSKYQPATYIRDLFKNELNTSELWIPPWHEGSVTRPADTMERQDAFSRTWLECGRTDAPRLDRVIWKPGPKDFHSVGP